MGTSLLRQTYIIAEAGVNHDGKLDKALRLVDVAAEAGADAVKFQAFRAAKMTSSIAPKAAYQLERTARDETQEEMLKKYELSDEAFAKLAEHARARGIDFICTPFDEESVELVAALQPAAIKVSSGDLTNHPLLKRIASKGYPVILSSGMATLGEVESALHVVENARPSLVIVLHCTSSYPADPKDVNLRAMETIRRAFAIPVGYSDHTLGIEVAIAAVALGACVIEKHFTLSRLDEGPDHAMSLEPIELQALVRSVRIVEQALGNGVKRVTDSEMDTRISARKSIHLAVDVSEGEVITLEKLCCLRPGDGISPSLLDLVVGRRARRQLAAGHKLNWQDI
ncbi:MAG: N-acetylneuraminate synthase [Candidatus Fermentithermobacillus carboniphilus]|uniref:N-acetylneuraminate synthase n=1 Tax=Candidatus Fermentithermobacillus carboniphilus TaxID=3085328 RepID=A0AAT9LH77_9FIRM|nr:MAG: N-acetylneuraminate synthase [Candidatus Fermentithermobacillus carboniphilus]